MPIVKVNPRQAKRFADPIGQLAKTARLDAACEAWPNLIALPQTITSIGMRSQRSIMMSAGIRLFFRSTGIRRIGKCIRACCEKVESDFSQKSMR
ncbi:MAG: hypothetical protein ING72_09005 [Methylobacterium sp.]|nr:hypothetical protein [Methylobacterium sp.]MCA3603077.1 hypothetical protein [Methylobacterium sp.]MCA3614559.1 hypothetical protein [Methylobacterium sp.]MCA4910467.1 hypothetical protein [Methylobacterium sp.]